MIRRPPRTTQSRSSAASDVYKRQIPPNDFIPLAEQTRLILPIGAWVIEEACAQLARWRDAGYANVRVAVNLAAEQLADEGLVALVRECLERHELAPAQLEVEITERTAI